MRTPLALLALAASPALAQSTVDYTSTAWSEFGTTFIEGASGNFHPGWTSLTASPDVGNNLFFIPTTSLSGAPDDAGLWLLHYDAGGIGAAANESVRLSLSGFTPGQTYELAFFATLYQYNLVGWVGNNDALDIAITGADIADFDTTVLSDLADGDGVNTWDAQSLVFTATGSVVSFDFGANNVSPVPGGGATRIGIDGFNARAVPAPASLMLLAAGMVGFRRRR